jgi:hypothetical protein
MATYLSNSVHVILAQATARTRPIRFKVLSCFAPLSVNSAMLLDGVFRGLLDSCHGFSDWVCGGPALRYPASLEHSTVADELPFVLH